MGFYGNFNICVWSSGIRNNHHSCMHRLEAGLCNKPQIESHTRYTYPSSSGTFLRIL